MSIDAMKMALEALWDCTVKLESQQFRNPVQIPPVYSDIIKAGYLAHAALRAAITEAERQEPIACQYAKDVGMPEYQCVGKCQYTTPQPAIPDGWQLVPVEPIKTGDPEISREHLVAIAEKCGLLGAYRTREVVDAIVGYGQVILRDKAVQEAMYRASLAAAPKEMK